MSRVLVRRAGKFERPDIATIAEVETFHVWDKGIAHIAGNVNGKTIRRFPIVSEACVQYARIARREQAVGVAEK